MSGESEAMRERALNERPGQKKKTVFPVTGRPGEE